MDLFITHVGFVLLQINSNKYIESQLLTTSVFSENVLSKSDSGASHFTGNGLE